MSDTVNLYSKLATMRVQLQEMGIKKTGQNKFSNYDYYELDDFLPQCNGIALKNNTLLLFHLLKDEATLTLINCENLEEKIIFALPVADLAIKGANAIQNIGGAATYTRRYLYMIAFEISEKDDFNSKENNEPKADNKASSNSTDSKKQLDEQKNIENQKISEIKIKVIRKELERTGVTEAALCKRYKIETLTEMTELLFARAMNGLEKSASKE